MENNKGDIVIYQTSSQLLVDNCRRTAKLLDIGNKGDDN
jgi:hypothetical protein